MVRRSTTLVVAIASAGCAATTASPGPVSPHGAADAPLSPPAVIEGEHFAVYRGDGSSASLDQVLARMDEVDAVLLGEEHDDRVGHRVQLALLEGAFLRYVAGGDRSLVLSMEMFERDVQLVVDEYMGDLITEEHFLTSARPWANYEADYRPLVEFAKAHDVPVVAANAPRRYVNRASRLGRESLRELPEEALETLAPLPYPEPSEAYRAEWDSLMGGAAGHGSGALLDGQTLWDATMAHSIARALETRPGALVLHLAGGFHVENRTGIAEVLGHYRPGVRELVVAVRAVEDPRGGLDPKEHAGRGDFVILTSQRQGEGSVP